MAFTHALTTFSLCFGLLLSVQGRATIPDTLSDDRKADVDLRVRIALDTAMSKIRSAVPAPIMSQLEQNMPEIHFDASLDVKRDALFYTENDGSVVLVLSSSSVYATDLERTLVHELFHVIHYLLNPSEKKTWVREGLALEFEHLVLGSYNYQDVEASFHQPWTEVTREFDLQSDERALYGRTLLFFSYLIRECGGADLFWKLVQPKNGATGTEGIEVSLRNHFSEKPQCANYNEARASFEVSYLHNHLNLSDMKNAKRYFLVTGMSGAPAPYIVNTAQEVSALKEAPFFTPIRVAPQAFEAMTQMCTRCRRYILHSEFPFSVEDVTGSKRKVDSVWIRTQE